MKKLTHEQVDKEVEAMLNPQSVMPDKQAVLQKVMQAANAPQANLPQG